jgi:hypothetical protein
MTSPSTIFPEGFWDWEEERREEWVEKWIVEACLSKIVPHRTIAEVET